MKSGCQKRKPLCTTTSHQLQTPTGRIVSYGSQMEERHLPNPYYVATAAREGRFPTLPGNQPMRTVTTWNSRFHSKQPLPPSFFFSLKFVSFAVELAYSVGYSILVSNCNYLQFLYRLIFWSTNWQFYLLEQQK